MGFPGLRYVPSEQANQGELQGDKSRVDVAIFSTAVEREASNRQGYAQLVLQCLGKPAQFFRRELGKQKQLGLYFASIGGNADALAEQLMLSVAWYCYFDGQGLPTTRQDFEQRMTARREALSQVFQLTLSVSRLYSNYVSRWFKNGAITIAGLCSQRCRICMLNWLSWCRKTCC